MRFLWTALAILVVASGVSQAQSRNGMVDGKTLDQWIKLLKSRDPSVVERAIQSITKFGPAARSDAGPELIKWVNDRRDVAVRSNAAFAIGTIGLDSNDVRAGVTALVRCLNDDTQRVVRFRAIYALGKLGPDADSATTTNALLSAMRDSAAWEVRAAAADALAKITYKKGQLPVLRVVTGLTRALNDRAAQVRLQAILALATVGAPALVGEGRTIRGDETQALHTLVKKDKDKGNAVWARAALLGLKLDQTNATKLISEIGKEMTNPELEVRVQTAAALGALVKTQAGDVRGLLPGLVAMLADKEPTAAKAASDTLVQVKELLSDRDVDRIAQLLHNNTRASARAAAAQTLGRLGDKSIRYIGELVTLIHDPEAAVASAACDALAALGEPAKALALPALNQVVISGPYEVRPSALRALIQLSQPKAEQQNVPNKTPAAR